ncbi:hypothetical protein FLA105534_04927 [Flavobacterium bizetiae]|uniref:Uncharacterized protein n=1 Tax=Flavobacterium bizetiae TaxID=2704140 RepID=A0A6J4GXZ0_9FLAO|nr:hypothetical protein [Flavobacterium bizetiae]CAA9203745.1 hypothetical protein FLA105534_04927 [Flavobacterium bizetiae]CAD5343027.1 hypothetical protein FLA105535_03025 [Flavobacterium bizetiae]CAD5350442.1 hypothetical protein FLA105534_04432 [Flavobacterium bizetiae]
MQRIKINELVEFRRKQSEKYKKNFAYKLKNRIPKEKTIEEQEAEEPRDYWVFSTSCIYNVFKNGNEGFYDPKIDELYLKMSNPNLKNSTYSMYKRNRDILMSFKEFEVNSHRPNKFTRQGVQKEHKTLTLEGFPLYVKPNLVFIFEHDGKNKVGALWLVPQVDGFKKSELGIFCEVLHRFLLKNYSDNYQISEDYCIAIDTFNAQSVTYSELKNQSVPFLLDSTLQEMKIL